MPLWRCDLLPWDVGKTPGTANTSLSFTNLLTLLWWRWFLHATSLAGIREPRSIHRQGLLAFSSPLHLHGPRLVHGAGAEQEHSSLHFPAAHYDVPWASQRWEMPASPVWFCWEALGKVNLARWRSTLAVDGGWSIQKLPMRGSTLPDLCFSWLTGAHDGSFLKVHGRAGASPWGKGCRQNLHTAAQHPTAILSSIAKKSRAMRMTNVTAYYQKDNSVTTFILRCTNSEKQPRSDDYYSFGI